MIVNVARGIVRPMLHIAICYKTVLRLRYLGKIGLLPSTL